MRVLITAGPTREYIDSVRFITNASSGMMGCAVATAAARAAHDVTLLLGAVASALESPPDVEIVRFTTVDDLERALDERFDNCDALVMAAAVGDFRPSRTYPNKLSRSAGPITLELVPTEDLLAGVGARKRDDQKIISFAVEDAPPGQIQAKVREKLNRKCADYVVVNTPAAMSAEESLACILSADGEVLPCTTRPKTQLAEEIVKLLD
ncbi:MAG: phosphopantothenoylcysteine decarboxylase domain-containing protein [Planctomycetota bacterium]|jgi:phosphopantothenoylcysteine decarboxylase/phosphopantothenate--cysteine ligase